MRKRYTQSAKPTGKGRYERSERRSRTQPRTTQTESEWTNTGAFTNVSNPDTGRSDYVRIANRNSSREAARAMKKWQRTLPKGVKV